MIESRRLECSRASVGFSEITLPAYDARHMFGTSFRFTGNNTTNAGALCKPFRRVIHRTMAALLMLFSGVLATSVASMFGLRVSYISFFVLPVFAG